MGIQSCCIQEAVKYIWFLYLKKFGYAFLDNHGAADTPTFHPVTPTRVKATPSHPATASLMATPSHSATPTNLMSPMTGSCRPQKRNRTECDGNVPTPKRSKTTKSLKRVLPSSSKGKSTASFDEFPSDSVLFDCSRDNLPEESDEEDESPLPPDVPEGQDPPSPAGVGGEGSIVSGNELYMLRRAKRRQKVKYFTVKFTIGLLYLGLLYTHQKILPSDLMR